MHLRSCLSGVALAGLALLPGHRAAAQATALPDNAPMPFIERIQPADFFAVEAALPGPLPKGAAIAIICTQQGHPAYALTLARNAEAEFDVTVTNLPLENAKPAERSAVSVAAPLDAPAATRLQQALAVKLARRVFVSDAARKPKDYDVAWWILQRTGEDAVQAALITGERAEGNPDAGAFLDAFVRGLERYATSDPDQRSQVLYPIDRYTIKVLLEEKTRR